MKSLPSTVKFHSFPKTKPPPDLVAHILSVFQQHEPLIGTKVVAEGLNSDEVLAQLRPDLVTLGFAVERGKQKAQKIMRPVFFGENGVSTLMYQIDDYHPKWKCGLEVEAGRAFMGNAV